MQVTFLSASRVLDSRDGLLFWKTLRIYNTSRLMVGARWILVVSQQLVLFVQLVLGPTRHESIGFGLAWY